MAVPISSAVKKKKKLNATIPGPKDPGDPPRPNLERGESIISRIICSKIHGSYKSQTWLRI